MAKKRYDLLVLPEDMRKIAPRAGEAWLRFLATNRVGLPYEESVAEDWVEVYCKPGPSAHGAFMKGTWDEEDLPFEELVVRFGTQRVDLEYGSEEETTFFTEFRGCLFDEVGGSFRNKFKDILYVRPAVFSRKFAGLPKHRVVPKDEEPKEKVRKPNPRGGVAGTSVEEF